MLEEVNRELHRVLATDSPILQPMVEYFLQSAGKGTRPQLVLLCGEVASTPRESSIDLAVAVELLHMASLVHDDILDQSSLRRNQPTLHRLWGEKAAILVGDYFFGKMMEMISRYPSVIPYFANVIQSLVAGEFLQMEQRYNPWLAEEIYLERIYHKTANFMVTCCKISSVVSDTSPEIEESLTNFGYYLGMAYQLLDDLQDMMANPEQIGKPILQDAGQGIYTLPILHAVRQSSFSVESLEGLKHLPEESLTYAITITAQYIQKALHSLSQLPNTEAKTGLQNMSLLLKKQMAKIKGGHLHAPSFH
jgi:heptaprenyl diphosphate synthase